MKAGVVPRPCLHTKNRNMKSLKFILCALFVLCCLFLLLKKQSTTIEVVERPAAFATLPTTPAFTGVSCAIDPNFTPVHHTARRHVAYLFAPLARAAGVNPAAYSIELMRDRRGHRAINAMTCADSRLIWISVTAWERLRESEAALSLLIAHELAHGSHRGPFALKHDAMSAAESNLLSSLTTRQRIEVAADQRAADIMARAGFSAAEINAASRYILTRDDGGFLAKATSSHPAGRDRANLLTFYVGRKQADWSTLAR